jgi:hypothetical protein
MNATATRFGGKQIAIIGLTLASAVIHFGLLFPDVLFILNSLGYLGFLAAYFLPLPIAKDNPRLVRLAFMGYVVINLLVWLAIGDKSWAEGWLGYVTKLIEIVLLGLLWSDRRSG